MVKIRQGFVSNSSSSSFIIVGVKLEEEDNIKLKLMDKFGIDYKNEKYPEDIFYEKLCYGNNKNIDVLPDEDGHIFVGKIIAQFSDDYLEDGELDFEDVIAVGDKLKEKDINGEVKFYYGTRMC